MAVNQVCPVSVASDGNCLFRTVPYALYGRESLHNHLRLLASIELLMHPELYDVHSDTFYVPFQCDSRIVLPNYDVSWCDIVATAT